MPLISLTSLTVYTVASPATGDKPLPSPAKTGAVEGAPAEPGDKGEEAGDMGHNPEESMNRRLDFSSMFCATFFTANDNDE